MSRFLRTFASACLVLPFVLSSPAAVAQAAEAANVPQRGPVQPLLQSHFELRKDVEKARGYRSLNEEDKIRLFQAQDRLFALLGDVRNFEDLGVDQTSELDAVLAELVLAQQAVRDQEVICRRERPTGSRIKETICHTRGELAQIELRAQRDVERRSHTGRSERVADGVGLFPPEQKSLSACGGCAAGAKLGAAAPGA